MTGQTATRARRILALGETARLILVVGVVAGALAAALVWVHAARMQGGVHGLPIACTAYADRRQTPSDLTVFDAPTCYDGQFFYRLARHPLSFDQRASGLWFDLPAYRSQRIGYGVLAWLVSLLWIPTSVALVVVNVLAIGTTAALAASWAGWHGWSPWWGLVAGLLPGSLTALLRDTSEASVAAFAMAAFVAWRRRRPGITAAALTAAVLTRETMILLALGFLVAAAARDRRALRVLLVPIVAFAAWQTLLTVALHSTPLTSGPANIGTPFVDLAHAGYRVLLMVGQGAWFPAIDLPLVVLTIAVSATALRHAGLELRVGWVLAAALVVSLTMLVWVDNNAYLRVTNELLLLSALALLTTRRLAPLLLGFAPLIVVELAVAQGAWFRA